jgi:hypothetical protein
MDRPDENDDIECWMEYADYMENLAEALEDMIEEDMRLMHRSSKPVYIDHKAQELNLGGKDETL